MIDPDRWHVLSGHLDIALEMSGRELENWLASLHDQDPSLAEDLRSLLAEHEALDKAGFLDRLPHTRPPLPDLPGATPTPVVADSLAGQTVGAYTLISRIGAGGMGIVWLARRSDGRFEGLAAVKLLKTSRLSAAAEERFTREGTILARLAHPSIAYLIDAGVTPGGQPYLVLEYVQGEHIDRYCDQRRLDLESRIRLFLDVLMAVAHAHANLVVHRDIKPPNVLVRTDGADGPSTGPRVKLLDFGIAKLLEEDAEPGASVVLTQDSGWAVTPAFAAPEQLTGRAITTSTDVYALGVLLYLLLGGRHPAGSGLQSPADLIAAIVDTEPPRLSETVTAVRPADDETDETPAAMRGTSPDKLRRALRGDLETIVGTALKKDPRERYPTVTAFADDLQRYLDQRPIRARPDTWTYRATKFVRRNRLAAGLTVLAVAAAGAGVAGTVTQARRATRQAALAEAERRQADAQRDFARQQLSRAEAINELNFFLLSDAAPSGKPFTVGDLLAHAERVVDRPQGQTVQNRVELMVAVGRQYQLQEEHDKARRVLARAYELSGTLTDPSARARTGCAYASAISQAGEDARAEALFQSAVGLLPSDPQFTLDRVHCLMRGSEVAQDRGDVDLGVERAETAQRLLGGSREASAVMELAVSMRVAESYRQAARYREANAVFEQAFERLTTLGRDDTERAGTLLNNWGMVLYNVGRPLDANRAFRRAMAIGSTDSAQRDASPMVMTNLARTERDLHRLPAARDYADRAYANALRSGHEIVVHQSLILRSSIYRELGDLDVTSRILLELERRLNERLPAGHIAFASLASEQALLAAARGDFTAAIAASDRSLAIAEASGQRGGYMARYLLDRANIELRMGRLEDAREHASRALALEQAAAGPDARSCEVGRVLLALGRAWHGQDKLADARGALSSAVEHLSETVGPDHPDTRLARELLAGGHDRR